MNLLDEQTAATVTRGEKASHEFRNWRATNGNGGVKQRLLQELRDAEIDLDHYVIWTCGKNPDPKKVEARQQTEAAINDLVAQIKRICLPPKEVK